MVGALYTGTICLMAGTLFIGTMSLTVGTGTSYTEQYTSLKEHYMETLLFIKFLYVRNNV